MLSRDLDLQVSPPGEINLAQGDTANAVAALIVQVNVRSRVKSAVEKWRKTMATATAERATSHGITADHVKQFEKKVNAMKASFAALPPQSSFDTLLQYIHRPGWTTPAESVFFETMVDSVIAQTQQLAQLHKQMMAGAALVGHN